MYFEGTIWNKTIILLGTTKLLPNPPLQNETIWGENLYQKLIKRTGSETIPDNHI
jgi:hypothetical protein